jgi:hypothetical protein
VASPRGRSTDTDRDSNETLSRDEVISIIQEICSDPAAHPDKGFQIAQDIPMRSRDAFEELASGIRQAPDCLRYRHGRSLPRLLPASPVERVDRRLAAMKRRLRFGPPNVKLPQTSGRRIRPRSLAGFQTVTPPADARPALLDPDVSSTSQRTPSGPPSPGQSCNPEQSAVPMLPNRRRTRRPPLTSGPVCRVLSRCSP